MKILRGEIEQLWDNDDNIKLIVQNISCWARNDKVMFSIRESIEKGDLVEIQISDGKWPQVQKVTLLKDNSATSAISVTSAPGARTESTQKIGPLLSGADKFKLEQRNIHRSVALKEAVLVNCSRKTMLADDKLVESVSSMFKDFLVLLEDGY